MQDMRFTLDPTEHVMVDAYQISKLVSVYVANRSERELLVSIEIDGEEKLCIKVTDNGSLFTLTKAPPNLVRT